MKRSTSIAVILAATLVAALACSKQSLRTTYDRQTTNIESFITAQMRSDANARLTKNSGAYRLTLHDTLDASRDSLLSGGKVVLQYACYTLTSSSVSKSNLVSTNSKAVATAAGWSLTDTTRFKLDTLTLDGALLSGLEAGLYGVQEEDEASILFTGEYGFQDKECGTIPARSALVYQVWIHSIDNE